MRNWFTSRLYRKMFASFLIVALVPLCAVYLYINSRYSARMEEDAASINQLAERNTGIMLNDFLMKAESISNLFFNSNTQKILKEPGTDELSVYNAQMNLEKVVRVSLDLYKIMDRVDQVTFISRNGTGCHVMNSSKPVRVLPFDHLDGRGVNAYKNHVLLSMDEVSEGKLVYVRRIDDVEARNRELGYLYVVFDRTEIDRIFSDLSQVLDTRVVLKNQNGEILYANFEDAASWTAGAEASELHDGIPADTPWIKWDYSIDNFVLTLTFYDEVQKLNLNIQELNHWTEIVILLTIGVILTASFLFARTIVTPVLRLQDRLVRVRSGDFQVRVPVETKDELGDVGLAFNDMAEEIDRLVNQVYTIRIKEKEAAIAALQAQINPHFLYNTLDMIKSMADIYEAGEVSSVIVALSGLFRYATHTDTVIVTIQEELSNLHNYMKIVNARLGGRISCSVDVPEELLKRPIVKVCLQPIVENSISHGLRRGGKARKIIVRFEQAGSDIMVTVRDDGVGIDEERLKEIRRRLELPPREDIKARAGSVGLKNIHDRIRLYYGSEYGVTIESRLGEGTIVTVRYPADKTPGQEPQDQEPQDQETQDQQKDQTKRSI